MFWIGRPIGSSVYCVRHLVNWVIGRERRAFRGAIHVNYPSRAVTLQRRSHVSVRVPFAASQYRGNGVQGLWCLVKDCIEKGRRHEADITPPAR